MQSLRVTKMDKGSKFEWFWRGIIIKKSFQRQSFAKYIRLTLIFMSSRAPREKFNFYFPIMFC